MWTSLRKGEDLENGIKIVRNGKPVTVNSAMWGFDNAMNHMTNVMTMLGLAPIHFLMVFEGVNSKSKRVLHYSGYKAGTEKAPEEYEQFHKLKGMLVEQWSKLGAMQLQQDYAEGDDTLGWLAKNTESDLTIVSNDGDLSILAGVNEYGATVHVFSLSHQAFDRNPIAPVSLKYLTLYKALVGDTSDKIKGCVGFGDTAWENFIAAYGEDGLDELDNLIRNNTKGPLEKVQQETGDKSLRLIVDQWQAVCASHYVAQIHPEWVDTMESPLQVTPGFVRRAPPGVAIDRSLANYYATGRLVTRANIDKLLPMILEELQRSDFTSLDIETSPTDESAQWAESLGKGDEFVDVLGASVTGLSLTFGANQQHSVYFSIDHANTENLTFAEVWTLVQSVPSNLEVVIQNVNFELPVLYLASGGNHVSKDEFGFIPNVRDTKIEAAYVNEDVKRGLKERSKLHLSYEQQTYDQTTLLTGPAGTLFKGGQQRRVWDELDEHGVATGVQMETRRYSMRELPATHVTSYGLDDTRCTSMLHVYYRFIMEMEHTWQAYLETEIDAAYGTAAAYLDGVPFNLARMKELAAADKRLMDSTWATVSAYLAEQGWAGTVCPILTPESTPKDVKEAIKICCGFEFKTAVRTPSKLHALMATTTEDDIASTFVDENGEPLPVAPGDLQAMYYCMQRFAQRYKLALDGDWLPVNEFIAEKFTGAPDFNFGSPKQKQNLLYEVMGLPIRVRNKPTTLMKQKGLEGSPKTDALAIAYALQDAPEREKAVLEALKLYTSCLTKFNLYYNTYPNMLHWRDGKLHPSVNQCQANTLRSSCAAPNFQQMPKHPKIEGMKVEFRQCIIPHKKNAVVVSMDFKAQELVIIADYSQDPNMIACFVGDSPKDMHILTGLNILRIVKATVWTYAELEERLHDKNHADHAKAKQARTDGKKVNFTTEYGAMAEKLSQTMMVPEDVAQCYIDAKLEAFPRADAWKDEVVEFAKTYGYVTTKGGARRHLRAALTGSDRWEASKAERQAVNFKVQGSSAEQTKRAQGRVWRAGLIFKYDCSVYGPIHDELVSSCVESQLEQFLPEMHACMVAQYADVKLPIVSEISFGPNFGEQIEIGGAPTLEAIRKGKAELDKLLGCISADAGQPA
jgi:5'-3' exonuclease